MKTKIYWSPIFSSEDNIDWNILYKEPENLHKRLIKNIDKTINKNDNLIFCPAVKNLTNNIFVLEAPLESSYEVKGQDIIHKSKNYIGTRKPHSNNFKDNYLFVLNISYIFFTEEDIDMTLTSPYFSNSPHLKFGSIVPGKFNISKWFRNFNLEINLWTDVKEFILKEGEDLAYVHFDSDKEIELIRFDMNDKLLNIMRACASSTSWERFVPFIKRYKRFKESLMNKKVIKEIKNNIV